MTSEAQKAAMRRYNASPKGRAARERYMQTERGREVQRLAKARSNRKNAESIRIASYKRKSGQRERIDQIKQAAGCTDCGYSSHPAALEFDHVNGDKSSNVSRLIGSTWDRIEAEIAKCEVVCANCHRIRTVERCRR